MHPGKQIGVFLLLSETYILIHTLGYIFSIFRVSGPSGDMEIKELKPENANRLPDSRFGFLMPFRKSGWR